jgi:hypothetical protein
VRDLIWLALPLFFTLFCLPTVQAQGKVETVPAEFIVKKLGLKPNSRLRANSLVSVSKSANGLKSEEGFHFVPMPISMGKSRFTVLAVIPAEFKTFNVTQLSTASGKGQPILSGAKDAIVFACKCGDSSGKLRQVGNSINCAGSGCIPTAIGPKDGVSENDFLVIVPNYK